MILNFKPKIELDQKLLYEILCDSKSVIFIEDKKQYNLIIKQTLLGYFHLNAENGFKGKGFYSPSSRSFFKCDVVLTKEIKWIHTVNKKSRVYLFERDIVLKKEVKKVLFKLI